MNNQKEVLKESCDKVVDYSYMKQFTPDEISGFKSSLSERLIELKEKESEFAQVKEEFKEQTKPLKSDVEQMVLNIRDKARLVKEECYVMFEGMYAVYYNADGEEVHKRPLEASEKQRTIFMETRKTAINE